MLVVVGRAGVLVGAEMERAHIVIEDGWGRQGVPAHARAQLLSEDPASASCQYIINPFRPLPVYFSCVPHILAFPTS